MPASAAGNLSLRISVTDRCPLHCIYCRPSEGVPLAPRQNVLHIEEILEFVRRLGRFWTLTKVHLTGGEPLLRRGLVTLVRGLADMAVTDLALTTSGQGLAEMAADLHRAGLRRINVSLDTLEPRTYRSLTRGGRLEATIEGIDAALAAGFSPVKINTVVLRGVNDAEVTGLARFAIDRGCIARFLEVMPIGEAGVMHCAWFVPASEVLKRLRAEFAMEPDGRRPGESATYFTVADGAGRRGLVGFIAPWSEPFCGDCRRLRLTTTGRLLGCLARRDGIDIRGILRSTALEDDAPLVAAVEAALQAKKAGRCFSQQHLMVRIGG